MGVFEELEERGLIAQVTDREGVRDLLDNRKTAFYIGFDPTADSLHVGHYPALRGRDGDDWRPFRKDGNAPDDDKGRDRS